MDHRIPLDRIEPVAVAARRILHEGWITDVTVRNLAIYVGCSPSTLNHRFGTKTNLLAHVVRWLGESWLEVVYRETTGGTDGVLSHHEVAGAHHLRDWLAMCELGRGDDRLALEVADVESEQRRLLERVLPPGTDQATRDAWVALNRGLLHDLGARSRPLPLARARAAVGAFARLLSDPAATTPRSA